MRGLLMVTMLQCLFCSIAFSQADLKNGWWRVLLLRADTNTIAFNFEVKQEKGKKVLYVRNAKERMKVDNIALRNDSVFIQMPVFESRFNGQLQHDGTMKGEWIKGTSGKDQVMPFIAKHGQPQRFPSSAKPKYVINGRWAMTILRQNGRSTRPAIATFSQSGTTLIGTILTPSGDYRFLEGVVSADSLYLSTFDGSHAYNFSAKIISPDRIEGGHFYSGALGHETWVADKNEKAILPDSLSAVYLKDGEERLNFTFPDLEGKLVSINDDRFKNKVVIIQLMGSWCPNCMDETAFLSSYYNTNRPANLEIISLAYEYSTDVERSRNSLKKFQDRFNVKYPMLITGVRTSDSLRTEKSLPQLTTVKALPTTIFIGKDGRVRKIHTGFYGPGTGLYHETFRKEFFSILEELLNEQVSR